MNTTFRAYIASIVLTVLIFLSIFTAVLLCAQQEGIWYTYSTTQELKFAEHRRYTVPGIDFVDIVRREAHEPTWHSTFDQVFLY